MLDFSFFMLWVKLPVTDRIHPQSNKFATGVENKAAQVTQNLMTALLAMQATTAQVYHHLLN